MSKIYRMFFDSLADEMGGVEGAAAVLAERVGNGHKGTVSKMRNGKMAVTCEAIFAMEDAAKRYPCTEFLADRIDRATLKPQDIMQLVASTSKEHGESISAVISSFSETSEDPNQFTEDELAAAIKEAREAESAARKLRILLEGMEL